MQANQKMAGNERNLRCTAPTALHRYLVVLEVGTKMMYISTNKCVPNIVH